ncbi:MAG: ComEC/Rec2 family competence protein [Bryobacterales bacterium]
MLEGVPACGGVRLTVNREPEDPPLRIGYGARVELLARVRYPENYDNPGAFDRIAYLRDRGIVMTGTMRRYAPIIPLEGRGGSSWTREVWRVREGLAARFEALSARAGLTPEPASLLRAMLLGDRSGLSEETKSAFERSGAYHALVVSGLHVGVAAAALIALLRLLGSSRWTAGAAGASFAGLYAMLLEGATPVSRAAWMLGLYLAASALFRHRKPLNVICAVALGFLLWKPALLADAGFQLSFLSVAAIAGIALPILEVTTEPRRRALLDIWNTDLDLHLPVEQAVRRVATRTWLEPLITALRLPTAPATWCITRSLRLLWGAAALLLVSAVLLVALAAPLAWHFQRLAATGPLTNLAVVPLVGVAVPAGLSALAINRPEPLTAAGWAANGMLAAARKGAQNLAGEWRVPPPPGWLAALAGLSLIAWTIGLAGTRKAALASGTAALAVFAVLALHPFPAQLEAGKLELTAIDVGQGEALLIGLPDQTAGLVDAGGIADFRGSVSAFDIGEEVVTPYLLSRSITRLRFLALTHPDTDHIGGATAILRNFQVDELWLGGDAFDAEYASLDTLARAQGVRVIRLVRGDERMLGGIAFQALNPARTSVLERNDLSLVLMAPYGEHELLLTGDIEAAGEALLPAQLAGVDAEVLKVSHHGSRTSSTVDLLETLRPEFALISAGSDNLYGHPHAEALERLRQAGAYVLRTDRRGLVTVLTDGRRLEVR